MRCIYISEQTEGGRCPSSQLCRMFADQSDFPGRNSEAERPGLNDRAGQGWLIIQSFKDRHCQQSSLRDNETRRDLHIGGGGKPLCTVLRFLFSQYFSDFCLSFCFLAEIKNVLNILI